MTAPLNLSRVPYVLGTNHKARATYSSTANKKQATRTTFCASTFPSTHTFQCSYSSYWAIHTRTFHRCNPCFGFQSTVSSALDVKLTAQGRHTYILDGDNVRHGLNSGLGFSPEDRAENVRRVGEVARLMVDLGIMVIVPVIRRVLELKCVVFVRHKASQE